jgi:8-oxo-dGTP diphosphatase
MQTKLRKVKRNISIGVGVVIVCRGLLLVTRRQQGSSWGAGALAMPGGHIEENEKAVDCARREALEETGLIVEPFQVNDYTFIMHATEWFRQGRHHWTVYIPAHIRGGILANPEPHKHDGWHWWSLEQLEAVCGPDDWIPLPALKANREILGL